MSEKSSARRAGFTAYCGLEFDRIEDDGCSVSCVLRNELLNPAGVAHGGLIATLTDVAAGVMALQADGFTRNIVTQSCSIHYLRPGTGTSMRADSTVIRKGGRVCVVHVDCFTDDGTLCATAIYEIAYLNSPY